MNKETKRYVPERDIKGERPLCTMEVPVCHYCCQKHPLSRCKVFAKITSSECLNILQERNLCMICFKHHDMSACYMWDIYPKCNVRR